MQHEVAGHIASALKDPRLLERVPVDAAVKDANEQEAIDAENRYRRRNGLPLVPRRRQEDSR